MSVVHNKVNYGLTVHGTVREEQWVIPVVQQSFFAVKGAQVIIGEPVDRGLSMQAQLTGYSTHAALLVHLSRLQKLHGMFGDLVVTVPTDDTVTYKNVWLLDVSPREDPWKDGSGVNDWQCAISIRWRHLANDA